MRAGRYKSANTGRMKAQMAHWRVCFDFSISLQDFPFVFQVCGFMLSQDGSSLWMAHLRHVQLQRNCPDVASASAARYNLMESGMRGVLRTTMLAYLVS
jgi:hypothetical protein